MQPCSLPTRQSDVTQSVCSLRMNVQVNPATRFVTESEFCTSQTFLVMATVQFFDRFQVNFGVFQSRVFRIYPCLIGIYGCSRHGHPAGVCKRKSYIVFLSSSQVLRVCVEQHRILVKDPFRVWRVHTLQNPDCFFIKSPHVCKQAM